MGADEIAAVLKNALRRRGYSWVAQEYGWDWKNHEGHAIAEILTDSNGVVVLRYMYQGGYQHIPVPNLPTALDVVAEAAHRLHIIMPRQPG